MPLITRFEEIHAWQQARKLTSQIYGITSSDRFSRDFGLRDQIQRAAVSSMSNIAEGFDCDSKLEFARFLGIARRSAVEVQSLLYVALDVHYINQQLFDLNFDQARKTQGLIGGFKHHLIQRA